MKALTTILLLVGLAATSQAQFTKDSLVYTSNARLTTAYTSIYLGPKGFQKEVDVAFDTAVTSVQTATAVIGLAADTNNSAKRYTVTFLYRTTLPTFTTSQDTLRIKMSDGSVVVRVLSRPYPLSLSR